jgi:primosomal protein N'
MPSAQQRQLEQELTEIATSQEGLIIVGTQMLAKGHDLERVTLVGIVDTDALLFSSDFRAEEKLAQLLTQVAGRAGRRAVEGKLFYKPINHRHHYSSNSARKATGIPRSSCSILVSTKVCRRSAR